MPTNRKSNSEAPVHVLHDYSLADGNWAPVHVLHFRTFFHTCPAKNRKWKQHSFQTCCLEANNNQGEANHRRKYGKNRQKMFLARSDKCCVLSIYMHKRKATSNYPLFQRCGQLSEL
jgi:hypothetical protein